MKYSHSIMNHKLSREQVREVDRLAIAEYGMSGLVLMENAALGVCEIVEKITPPAPVAILCGKGNNAGDGYAVARHLDAGGWPVHVFQLFDPAELRGDAEMNWKINKQAGVETTIVSEASIGELQRRLSNFALILDCMLGTGAQGNPKGPLAAAILAANAAQAIRVAVDLPTGIDCDTGAIGSPCFVADYTCTFVAEKLGFAAPAAKPFLGKVHVIGIGVPRRLLDETVDALKPCTH